MIRLILISLLFSSISVQLLAQSLTMNQIKYWDYRARLTTEFMRIGSDPGKSLPAESIHPGKREMRFADATVYLGWYLGTLSTEYHLSNHNAYLRTGEGKEVKKEETLLELYYALKAYERLDLNAEKFFEPDSAASLNGFFMREDVPEAFKNNFNMDRLESDFLTKEKYSNEMSQDQVIHLLMGLMCVKTLIPENTKVKGENIRQMAIDNGVRIINWMKQNKWYVVNPVVKDGKQLKKVHRGSLGYIFSEGLNRILVELTDGEKDYGKKVNPVYKVFWGTMRSRVNPTYYKNDNRHLSMTVAATGNGFRRKTYRKLYKRAKPHEWYVYPLLNLMLYGDNRRFKTKDSMEESLRILSAAPAGGPVCPYPGQDETAWGANHKFLKDLELQIKGRYFHEGKQFNGLDYMLFYNLYLIHRNGLLITK